MVSFISSVKVDATFYQFARPNNKQIRLIDMQNYTNERIKQNTLSGIIVNKQILKIIIRQTTNFLIRLKFTI